MSSAGDTPEQEGDLTPVAGSAVQPDVAALYERYADAMHASARKVLDPNSMDSDVGDAVSTVMKNLQAAHVRGQLENKDNWESYLRWSARNAALAIVRDRRAIDSLEEIDDSNSSSRIFHDRTEGMDPVADQVIQRFEERDVRAAITRAGFTDRQLYVLYGYFVRGMTHEQVGDWLGVSGQAVGRMRHRAQDKLRELLEGGDSR
jgi:RNA polymerase sigma factor (sigma-70 family)